MTFVLSTRNKVSTFAAATHSHIITSCTVIYIRSCSFVSNEHTSEHYDDDYNHEISNIHKSHMNAVSDTDSKNYYCISRNTNIIWLRDRK